MDQGISIERIKPSLLPNAKQEYLYALILKLQLHKSFILDEPDQDEILDAVLVKCHVIKVYIDTS